jgi:hypothetical protein
LYGALRPESQIISVTANRRQLPFNLFCNLPVTPVLLRVVRLLAASKMPAGRAKTHTCRWRLAVDFGTLVAGQVVQKAWSQLPGSGGYTGGEQPGEAGYGDGQRLPSLQKATPALRRGCRKRQRWEGLREGDARCRSIRNGFGQIEKFGRWSDSCHKASFSGLTKCISTTKVINFAKTFHKLLKPLRIIKLIPIRRRICTAVESQPRLSIGIFIPLIWTLPTYYVTACALPSLSICSARPCS